MASRAQSHVQQWKYASTSSKPPLRPARARSNSEPAPILLHIDRRNEQKDSGASVLLALAPGTLGGSIKWPLMLLDFCSFVAAALIVRHIVEIQHLSADNFALRAVLQSVLTFLFALLDGVYSPGLSRGLSKQLLVLGKASLLAFMVMALVAGDALLIVGCYSLLSIFTLAVFRMARHEQRAGNDAHREIRNVLIVGAGLQERDLADALHKSEDPCRRVVGFLDDRQSSHVLGKIADLSRVARAEFVDEIIVGNIARSRLPWVMQEAARNRLNISIVPELFGYVPTPDCFECAGDFALLKLRQADAPYFAQLCKRATDVVASGIGLLASAPVLAAIAILIKLDSKGPALYRSARAGRKGREFTCFKFRTMVANADALKDSLRDQNERSGPFFKIAADPRVTRAGRWLRRYSLDELPQLWNVLRGDMSLVGPRPHPLDDYQQYRLEHLKRLDVTPGLTGLWQVTARSDPSFQHSVALDLDYIERWSIWLDLRILFQTVRVVFSGSGA